MADDKEKLSPADVESEREILQQRLSDALDLPMTILALVWVALIVVDLALPLSPEFSDRVIRIDFAIWFIFVVDFALEFALAPDKLRYLRSNFLVALSLILPFIRIVRVFRLARVIRSVSLVRITLMANRGITAIGEIFSRHGIHYLVALSAIVTLLGAAGVYFFERGIAGSPFHTFWDALWWSATMLTTINIGADPVSFEGRVIAILMRAFAIAIFGYVAASFASYLIGHRVPERAERNKEREAIDRLTGEVERLSAILNDLQARCRPIDRSDE